ncbi:hypothetical protein EDD22DRAFT_980812 [Suillus occidentalis]|nr:hypothetical protein EDD22DRAFT_980812 [Suillus occidentalis]
MPSKHTRNDENLVFNIIDTSIPPPKRTRCVLVKLSAQELQVEQAILRTEELQSKANAKASELSKGHLQAVFLTINSHFPTLHSFSAHVLRMLGAHGGKILALMHQFAREGKVLAEFLRPSHREDVSEILGRWSLDRIQTRAQDIAPTLCKLLKQGGFNESLTLTHHNHGLVFTTILCILVQTSHFMFEVLHHARNTSSYTKAVYCLKKMGTEYSKDHFDNGTTATLIPLIDISNGHLSLDFLPPWLTWFPIINFGPQDLLPSLEQVQQLEATSHWHILDVLLDAFPSLCRKFADNVKAPPVVLSIPVHQMEQYPLPAMHIDESSIDRALEVIDSIVQKTLKMSSEDIQKHRIIMCTGDQLTMSLLDRVGIKVWPPTASRHDNSDLFDNVGSWTHPQLGLFHVKLAATQMVVNEVNSLLRQKAISAGWKAKILPTFRPSWDLILALALPANILDAFCLCCGCQDLEQWVENVKDYHEVEAVAKRVQVDLCSAQRAAELHWYPSKKRDVPLTNIMLFNCDALVLRELRFAIRRGDIGSVVNVLTHWMVMLHGTRSMLKYADALFHLLVTLKQMRPELRDAYLRHWLINLTGHVNSFKEVDLLQEHQNFWAKIIYCACRSNRSWEWLSMVSISIFAFYDVIRKVRNDFQTPGNTMYHTSPATTQDIHNLQLYLEHENLQSYTPTHKGNDFATATHNLMIDGASYANTARAFNSFHADAQKAKNLGSTTKEMPPTFEDPPDALELDNLTLDDEEYIPDLDQEDLQFITQEMIDVLSQYDH